jgi:hypothetical protein
MAATSAIDPNKILGRSPDRLTLEESRALVGKFIALEIYAPATLPFRRIEALGDSADECIRQLMARGLDPTHFEFTRLKPAYAI